MTKVRAIWMGIGIGMGLGLGAALGLVLFRDASHIAVAWGNAEAERERRLAVEAPFRAQQEKEREAQIAANAAHNEANCKITIKQGRNVEVVTGIRKIESHYHDRYGGDCYVLHFGGGVTRHVDADDAQRTDSCR